MEITETVRGSSWDRRSSGRRVMNAEPPFFSISYTNGVAHRDAARRQALRQALGA